jgi:hypothetical protein
MSAHTILHACDRMHRPDALFDAMTERWKDVDIFYLEEHVPDERRAPTTKTVAGGMDPAVKQPAEADNKNKGEGVFSRETPKTISVHNYDDLPDLPTDMALNKEGAKNPFDRKVRGADLNTVALKPRMSALYHEMGREELIALCAHRLDKYAVYLGIRSVDAYVQQHAPPRGMDLNMKLQVSVGVGYSGVWVKCSVRDMSMSPFTLPILSRLT